MVQAPQALDRPFMCGRYTLTRPGDLLEDPDFGLSSGHAALDQALLLPRYNIAPTQPILAVRERPPAATEASGQRQLIALRWGLLPGWAATPPERPLINARVETLAEKPSFRESLSRRRCLIPADGFFEWRRREARRRPGAPPWYFSLRGGATFAFAGIWDRWQGLPSASLYGSEPEPAIESCCIVTTDANQLVARVHDRMPVILPREQWARWLDPATDDADALLELLRPAPAEAMESRPVGALVNRVDSDGPGCIALAAEPAQPAENLKLF